jgi:hypothetical protein
VVENANSGKGRLSDLLAAEQLVDSFRAGAGGFCACEFRSTFLLDPSFRQPPGLPEQGRVTGMARERAAAKIGLVATAVVDQFPEIKNCLLLTRATLEVAESFLEGKAKGEVQTDQHATPTLQFIAQPIGDLGPRPARAYSR